MLLGDRRVPTSFVGGFPNEREGCFKVESKGKQCLVYGLPTKT